jgi:hypothetical protein
VDDEEAARERIIVSLVGAADGGRAAVAAGLRGPRLDVGTAARCPPRRPRSSASTRRCPTTW